MENDIVAVAACAAHEVNRAFCESLGDYSQPTWMEAPEWQRNSAMSGVEAIRRAPAMQPHESHESWMAQKQREGWTYGEVKDPAKKTHPCMVPYDELPIEQRAKDYLFGTTVRAVLGLPLPTVSWGDVK